MADDIVQRLRSYSGVRVVEVYTDVLDAAADEIERLRAENDRLRRAATLNAPSDYMLRRGPAPVQGDDR